GQNPLQGPNETRLGVRFPDMTEVYSAGLRQMAIAEAERLKIPISTGVYACVPGPTYETPAEIRMLRTLGADAVGMSTVPEVIAANHLGMRVAALSCITNLAAGLTSRKLSHAEVIINATKSASKMIDLLNLT